MRHFHYYYDSSSCSYSYFVASNSFLISFHDIFLFIQSTWNSGMMLTEDIIKSVMASSVSSEKSNKNAPSEIEYEDV